MAPHSGVGGGEPRPRYDKPENSEIALPKSTVANTIIEPILLGRISLTKMRMLDAPKDLAALIYSLFLPV